MKRIKVAAAVLNQIPLDWDGNAQRIREAIRQARADNVSILCLPEMCINGYNCEDAYHSPGIQQTALEMLHSLVPDTAGMMVCFGLPLLYRNGLFNTVCTVVDGEIRGFIAKRYLAGDGLHYEPRWFNPWPPGTADEVTINGRDYPVGDVFFDLNGIKVGFEVCEDAWVAQRPGAALAYQGVDIILNPSASHFAFGKLEVRKRFVLEGSRAFGVSYLYANLLGNEAGRSIYDGGALIATAGQLVACGPRFSYSDVVVTSAVVDVDLTRMIQSRTHSFSPTFDDDEAYCVKVDFDVPTVAYAVADASQPDWEDSEHLKEEEFTRAIALSLFDYMRKSYSRGFVISLSGGADSSACACLVRLMAQMALADLGDQAFFGRLGYFTDLPRDGSLDDLVRALLLTVYQGTRNSSDTTRNAASTLAAALGAEHLEVVIDEIVDDYTRMVSGAIGRELTWEQDDIPLQNIQARVRGPSVWFLANLRNALLVSTSNRSEAAVGYATMDGDTCGGISPIAGIDKAFLRQWLRWLEAEGPHGLGPVPALSVVNAQQPTAELRPPDADQTDEGDLMPYPVLDFIERLAIRDKMMPLEIYGVLRVEYTQYGRDQLVVWLERFFKLWCRNQWKRERYAPSFHVDDENLDPKTWCRFPILSAGFKRELATLRAAVAEEGEG